MIQSKATAFRATTCCRNVPGHRGTTKPVGSLRNAFRFRLNRGFSIPTNLRPLSQWQNELYPNLKRARLSPWLRSSMINCIRENLTVIVTKACHEMETRGGSDYVPWIPKQRQRLANASISS